MSWEKVSDSSDPLTWMLGVASRLAELAQRACELTELQTVFMQRDAGSRWNRRGVYLKGIRSARPSDGFFGADGNSQSPSGSARSSM